MITDKEIKDLAILSRIEISEDEAVKLAKEASPILEYFSELSTLEFKDSSVSFENINSVREDIATNIEAEFTEKILSLAPEREGDFFRVKKIL